jgi:hypothetical protein
MKIMHGFIGTISLLWAVSCFAQIDQSNFVSATTVDRSTANFYFAKPNELTIIVNLIGFVQRPGRYEISNAIDLPNLISLAGGPTTDGALDDIDIIRMIRNDSRIERREINIDLEKMTKVRAEDYLLQPGDFIYVNRTSWSIFRDGFGVVLSAAVLTVAVTQVIESIRNSNR